MDVKKAYKIRFNKKDIKKREYLWVYLCKNEFQKYIKKTDTVMDIGAGYCEFINNINCKNKIAVDINKDTKNFADKDVDIQNIEATKIPKKYKGKIDVVFMSNFLEHIATKDEVLNIFNGVQMALKQNGKIIILQPNIDLVKTKYWNFFDHKIELNIPSITEGLEWSGFKVEKSIKRFLPYTTKSIFPKSVFFLKIYMLIPPFLRPFAGQSLIYAKKNNKENN